jgi:hypothetical protein
VISVAVLETAFTCAPEPPESGTWWRGTGPDRCQISGLELNQTGQNAAAKIAASPRMEKYPGSDASATAAGKAMVLMSEKR